MNYKIKERKNKNIYLKKVLDIHLKKCYNNNVNKNNNFKERKR